MPEGGRRWYFDPRSSSGSSSDRRWCGKGQRRHLKQIKSVRRSVRTPTRHGADEARKDMEDDISAMRANTTKYRNPKEGEPTLEEDIAKRRKEFNDNWPASAPAITGPSRDMFGLGAGDSSSGNGGCSCWSAACSIEYSKSILREAIMGHDSCCTSRCSPSQSYRRRTCTWRCWK